MITICLLALIALLLLGSIGAFFLCFPVLPVALVVVILLGMALLFLLGLWVGATRVLEPGTRSDGVQRLRFVRVTEDSDLSLASESDGQPDLLPARTEGDFAA